jgi:hypothetical protein
MISINLAQSLKDIFYKVQPFYDENLEIVRKDLIEPYNDLRSGLKTEKDVANRVHAGLVAFKVVYEHTINKKTKSGLRILPSTSIADFNDRYIVLKQTIKAIEKSGFLTQMKLTKTELNLEYAER